MALNIPNETLKLLFVKKLFKILEHKKYSDFPPVSTFRRNSKSVTSLSNTNKINSNHRTKKLLLLSFDSHMAMRNINTYQQLIDRALSHTKYSTQSDKCPAKPPPGRHLYHQDTEESINQQISAELNAAFAYLSMACYFGRSEIALPGCQGFFMNMYEEELGHATIFINYQLMRGAQVRLFPINVPECQDWKCIAKAFTVSVEMEKIIKEKLITVYDTAEKHKDLQVMDLISTHFMEEQNNSICDMARHLARAKMVEDPIGEYLFDKLLYDSYVAKSKNNLMYKRKLEETEEQVYK